MAATPVAVSVTPAAASDITENITPKQNVIENVIGQVQGPTKNITAQEIINLPAVTIGHPQKAAPSRK